MVLACLVCQQPTEEFNTLDIFLKKLYFTGLQFVPATRHVTSPPSLEAAVMAFNETEASLPFHCSAITSVPSYRRPTVREKWP